MTEKDISRWHDTITPQEKGKPWVLGSGGSWDLKDIQPIPDEMLAELAQRYHYAGTPWNCRNMPLTPSDREYMYLIYYSMQGLVARLRIAEQKAAESLADPAVANAENGDALPPRPDTKLSVSVAGYKVPVWGMQSMDDYAHSAIDHAAPNAQLVEDAARWQFMMRIADNEDGPEAKALESLKISNELMDDSRQASAQLIEMADQARAALASLPPQKEAL